MTGEETFSESHHEDYNFLLSKSDYESMMETFHLLKSPKNASRLMEGIEEYKKALALSSNITSK